MTFNPDYLSQTPLPESLSSNILPELQGVPGGGREEKTKLGSCANIREKQNALPSYLCHFKG